MKKTNKILTRALVILLALVLITSSVVSSTFAKYVITKKAETTVGLREFGLDITVTPKLGLLGDGVQTEKNGKSLKITYDKLLLKPNDNYENAIEITIDGKPVVDARITIDVEVTYSDNAFTVNRSDFSSMPGNEATATYVPIAFTVGTTKATVSYNNLSAIDAAKAIEKVIAENHSGFVQDENKTVVTKDITATSNVYPEVNETIGFGFRWDDVAGDNAVFFDHLGTWLAEQEHTVTVTYTVTVEQITGT